MKLSYYLVIEELENESFIYYSTYSNKSILLNKRIHSILQNSKIDFELLNINLIKLLIEYSILVNNDINELERIIKENKTNINNSEHFYIAILPTSSCQMGCDYCGQTHSNEKISNNIINKILDFIDIKLSEKKYSNLTVGWFGGEPLIQIKMISEASIDLIKLANKYNITYTAHMASNGLLLNSRNLEILSTCKIISIDVTLDGTKELHDVSRKLKNGKTSFDKIIKNLENFTQSNLDINISIRTNVHKENFNDIFNLYNLLKEKKILNKCRYYITQVHAWGNDAHNISLSPNEFAELETKLLLTMIKDGFNSKLIPDRNFEVCMVVNKNTYIFDHIGNAFSCSELPLVEKNYDLEKVKEFNINDHNILDVKTKQRLFYNWNDKILNSESKSPCSKCVLLPICGGGCPKNWSEEKGNCPSFKYNFNNRLKLQYYEIKN